jgi:hypothetical protein
MTPYSNAPAASPRNALIIMQPAQAQPATPSAPPRAAVLLANAIGHAAVLSDTPEKWAGTIAMLRKNGIDTQGYEDFQKGRPAAISASCLAAPKNEAQQPEEE